MIGINFEDVKREIENLDEYDVILEELGRESLFRENSLHSNDDVLLQYKLLISEIKEKQEIKEKLKSLSYNVNELRSVILTKDKDQHHNFILRVVENNHSCMNSVIDDLNSLKTKIEELESLHAGLFRSNLPLDVKLLLDQSFKQKPKKLNELHTKQKKILLNLSNMFLKLTKDKLFKKR